jgi:hypothetical protein
MTLTPTSVIQGGFPLLTVQDGWWLDTVRVQRLFPSSALDAGRALRNVRLIPKISRCARRSCAPRNTW